MEDAEKLRLADLIRLPRPITATASLPFLSTPSPPTRQRHTHHRILTALNRPSIIVGILTLPTHTASSSHFPCSCFRFSDCSATVCCDVLSFHPAAVGKDIRVIAWNFIPFKHPGDHGSCSGFLEIIKWRFSDPNEESNLTNLLPLAANIPGSCCNRASSNSRAVHGMVESIGPVSVVPCATATSGFDLNSGSKVNLPGFLVQLMCCECRLCGSREITNKLKSGSFVIGDMNGHPFTKLEILYFCGNASSFHPAITKLIGNRFVVSGLKKKLVYITKEESCLMYVTSDETVLRVCPQSKKLTPCLKSGIKGRGECGTYTGVIKGAYMQGMALELDNDVWLLLTDQLHTLIHGLRVGSIISVRNVHFVDPKFTWTKVIILGACVKTSIIVESFSPLETVCNVVLQSTSMLGKFIQSLPFSARLWVLLQVSSLRKKFAGILSDKEILGSKHKEGLAQMHASSLLPPSVFQTQAVPIYIFIRRCIDTLQRMLKAENHCKLLSVGNSFSILSRQARYNGRSARKIIPSEDVGVLLLGYLKIDPMTRRLQLVDAIGGIDVLIPDLPLTWNSNEIFEVTNYDVIVGDIRELGDQLELLDSESLSCRAIFKCTPAERELSRSIFVYCLWKNAKCRKFPFQPTINSKNDTKIFEPGSYHLLRISHKFPLQEKYSNDTKFNKCSMFVEAVLLPYILLVEGKGEILHHPSNEYGNKTTDLPKYCFSDNNEENVSNKRQKLIKESVNTSKDGFHTSVYELHACSNSSMELKENKKCVNLTSCDISCIITFISPEKKNVVCPALLCSASPKKDTGLNSKSNARKILLEFSSESLLKYQLLQIGGYYIIENGEKDCFNTTNDTCFNRSGAAKFIIDSGKHIWSLSFISDEDLFNSKPVYTSAKDSLSPTIDEFSPKVQIEQKLLRSDDDYPGVSSDVCLYLPISLTSLLEDNVMESEYSQIQKLAISVESANICFNETVVIRSNFCSGSRSSNCLFPEGNLISLKGNVVEIHDIGSSFCNSCSSGESLYPLQLKGLVGSRGSFCIHVFVHHRIVNIFGSISKHAFPTGFGPGVTATFHRILDARAQNKCMLLPVSFIVINSIKGCDKQCSDSFSTLRPLKDTYNACQDSFSCLISKLPQCLSHKQIVLRCRVVAVFVLVLEKTSNSYAGIKDDAKGILLDIPLAGFLLDDGSSSCCCWANSESAATLLRLQEELTTSYHLERILSNHKRITVRNHGSFVDFPYQDLAVSVTRGNALCSSDENLIKFIIFNACVGRTWNVVASVMDAEEVTHMEKEYLAEMANMQNMQHMWAKKVFCPRPLAEARNMIQELLKS